MLRSTMFILLLLARLSLWYFDNTYISLLGYRPGYRCTCICCEVLLWCMAICIIIHLTIRIFMLIGYLCGIWQYVYLYCWNTSMVFDDLYINVYVARVSLLLGYLHGIWHCISVAMASPWYLTMRIFLLLWYFHGIWHCLYFHC
jgi:hypothetical protein